MSESYFKQLAQDLMNIEINTIVKSEMSATKLPSSRRQALYELARDYDLKLKALGAREPVYASFAGLRSFGELRDRAKGEAQKLGKRMEGASPEEQIDLRDRLQILQRIADQSSQMVDIFKSLGSKAGALIQTPGDRVAPGAEEAGEAGMAIGRMELREDRTNWLWNNDISRDSMNEVADLDLTPDQVNRIRKAWEIGTERIQLQTVIQIDGDVTTRISESFLKNVNATLLTIHNDAIVISTGFWQSLVKTLGEMAGNFIKALSGK